MDRHLFTDLIENTEMRVVSALNKAVTKNCHLVHFEGVASHNIKKLLQAVFKEVKFSLLRIHIQKSVGNDGEGLNH